MSNETAVPNTIFSQPDGSEADGLNPGVREAMEKLAADREKAMAEMPDPYQVSFQEGAPPVSVAGVTDGASGDGGLRELLPQPASVTLGTGDNARTVVIRKWRVGDLKVISTNLTLIGVVLTHMTPFNLTDEELVHMLTEQQPEALSALLCHTLSVKAEDVDQMDLDDFERLCVELYKANISFFSKSKELAKRITQAPNGQTPQAEPPMTGST